MVPAAIAAGIIFGGVVLHRHDHPVPDEKATAVAALARQQDGSGYFHAVQTDPTPFDAGGPWITVKDAKQQEDRVIRERNMNDAQARDLDQTIATLAEPHPSRVIGGERIQLVKLNLALDSAH